MRILMLGNSLTTANDLSRILGELLQADVTVHARSGARLAEHLHAGTRLGDKTRQALENTHWDYVVLQEMSKAPACNRAAFLRSARALCNRIHAVGAVPVFFATWAYRNKSLALKKTGFSYTEMAERMSEAYAAAAAENSALLADVGDAFRNNYDENPYAADGVHPSVAGTRLAAQCIAHAIACAGNATRNKSK